MPTTIDRILGNPTVVTFAPNSSVQQQLQDNFAYDALQIRLTGNLTLASYSAPPSKYVESIENLIATFGLQAQGKTAGATQDQVCTVDGPFLRLKTRLMEGTDVTRSDVGTANGTYAFETNFRRYFADPRSDKSALTRMYTSLLNTLTAAYQFRDPTAMVYGGTGGTATLSGVQIVTQARAILGGLPPGPYPYVKETQRTANITVSENSHRIPNVPYGQILRRQYFKGLLGPVNFADPSDTVFGAIGKPEGPHISLILNNMAPGRLDQVYQQIRADNKVLFGVESMPTGWAVYEPARNRKLSSSLPLQNVSTADNFVDVNFTSGSLNTIQITDEVIIGVSAQQWAA